MEEGANTERCAAGAYGGKQGKSGDVGVGGSLNYRNHEIKEQGNEKVILLSFRTANFAFFSDLFGIITCKCALETIPTDEKFSKRGRRPAWMNKKLL